MAWVILVLCFNVLTLCISVNLMVTALVTTKLWSRDKLLCFLVLENNWLTYAAMELPCSSEVPWQNMMLPPPSRTFQDREDLISYVRDFGVSQGYVVTIRKSKKDRSVVLGCDRGGTYRNRRNVEEMKRKRKASSRLINCPFQAIGKKDDDVWVLTVRNGEHNHEPLNDISEHRYCRRLTEEEVKQIKLMTEAGAKPRQMLEALKQSNPEFQSTPRHLYNVKAKIRQGFSGMMLHMHGNMFLDCFLPNTANFICSISLTGSSYYQ